MRTLTTILLAASSLIACTAQDPVVDELGEETAQDGEDGKGDATNSFTFFSIRPDACSPEATSCGFVIARVNRSTTPCGFTVPKAECRVSTIDWTRMHLPLSWTRNFEERLRGGEALLVRGDVTTGADDAGVKLVATEVWNPGNKDAVLQGGALDGVYTRARTNGTQCVTAPCPSITESRLNATNRSSDIAVIDFDASGATAEAIDDASARLGQEGVIVVGTRYYLSDSTAPSSRGRSAVQFWTKDLGPQL